MASLIFGIPDQVVKKVENILKIQPSQLYYWQDLGIFDIKILQGLGQDISIVAYLSFIRDELSKQDVIFLPSKANIDNDFTLNIDGQVVDGSKRNDGILSVDLKRGVNNE